MATSRINRCRCRRPHYLMGLCWLVLLETSHGLVAPFASKPVSLEFSETPFAIETVASLLSYQCAEERLSQVLQQYNGVNSQHDRKLTHEIRGCLEDVLPQDEVRLAYTAQNSVVKIFLNNLDAALHTDTKTINGKPNHDNLALSTCQQLFDYATDYGTQPLEFRPPTRSLIGTIHDMDILLLRDKKDVHHRFSMLLSQDRAKGRKLARLHAEIDDHGILLIRGMQVHEQCRGQGLSTLLIAIFCQFCLLSFGSYPETQLIYKPLLCVALMSLGFTPEHQAWPALIAPHPSLSQVSWMSSVSDGPDLGPRFPHAVRRAQKLELVNVETMLSNQPSAREFFVHTRFLPPDAENQYVINQKLGKYRYKFYSARTVAFLSTMNAASDLMFTANNLE